MSAARRPRSRRGAKPKTERNGRLHEEEARRALELFERDEQRREEALVREPMVEERLERLRIYREAERRLRTEEAGARVSLPRGVETLADELAKPDEERPMVVADWLPAHGNGLLVAQYKSGKTTLALNLARSLADGKPFLGAYPVEAPRGRIALFNYEMDEAMIRGWSRDLGIRRPDRIVLLHLRGRTLPIWEDETQAELADWLMDRDVEFLIIDPAARAWSGLVENENDNGQVGAFTDALDALKRRAGIAGSLLTHHTGRHLHAEGEERARGATRLEDWMDAGWYLTKDREARSLRAIGRDISQPALALDYEAATRRLAMSGQTREERRDEDGALRVVKALAEWTGEKPPSGKQLRRAMKGDANRHIRWMDEAIAQGWVFYEEAGSAHLHELTKEGAKRAQKEGWS